MTEAGLDKFTALIKNQFSAKESSLITAQTDLKTLNEWSSLQIMIIVNEIDKEYNVILSFEDLKMANTVQDLYNTIQSRIK